MLPRERQFEIVKLVNRNGTVKTSELADRLNCTEETIRRDLDALEKQGKIVRSHGGAMSMQDVNEDLQHHKRESREIEEKQMIASTAASKIREGETIFIDESSTSLVMVDYLPADFEFNLVTNSLLLAKRVVSKSNITLHVIGGKYDETSFSLGGLLAEESIKFMSIDRFFFSCKGFHPELGATEASEERARLKKNLLKHSDWNCVLVDHTKLGIKAKFSFIFSKEVDLLVTDEAASKAVIQTYEKQGIKVEVTS